MSYNQSWQCVTSSLQLDCELIMWSEHTSHRQHRHASFTGDVCDRFNVCWLWRHRQPHLHIGDVVAWLLQHCAHRTVMHDHWTTTACHQHCCETCVWLTLTWPRLSHDDQATLTASRGLSIQFTPCSLTVISNAPTYTADLLQTVSTLSSHETVLCLAIRSDFLVPRMYLKFRITGSLAVTLFTVQTDGQTGACMPRQKWLELISVLYFRVSIRKTSITK